MNRRLLLVLSFVFSLISCATKPKIEGRAELIGRVASTDSKPLADCIVVLDGIKAVSTNSSGIFAFSDVSDGKHKIKVSKENFGIAEKNVNFINRQMFVSITCKSYKEILSDIEEYLEEKDLDSAFEVLKTLKKTTKEEVVEFYENLISYLKKPDEAKKKKYFGKYFEEAKK